MLRKKQSLKGVALARPVRTFDPTSRRKQAGDRMELLTVLFVIYAAVTAVALVMTCCEQRLKGVTSPLRVATGFGLCAAWPAVVAVMLIFYKPRLQDS